MDIKIVTSCFCGELIKWNIKIRIRIVWMTSSIHGTADQTVRVSAGHKPLKWTQSDRTIQFHFSGYVGKMLVARQATQRKPL